MTSTLSNNMSLEATGLFKPKFHLWHPWAGGFKVCVFMEISSLVWLLWQLRVSIDLQWGNLNNGIYCQAIADILTNFYRNVS